MTFDRSAWSTLAMDMPFAMPGAASAEEALRVSGCGVKSRERDPKKGGFPKWHGRLLSRSAQEVIVIGYGWLDIPDELLVWRGTPDEFDGFWECD